MSSGQTLTEQAIVNGIIDGLRHEKTADDDVKGIPERGKKSDPPRVDKRPQNSEAWERSVQRHHADQAGEHIDLRLGRPGDDVGISFALPKGEPDPGEKNLAVQTDDHRLEYFDFEGTIEDDYGKGEVELEKRDKVEVLEAKPDKIRFNAYEGPETKEMALIKAKVGGDEDNWLIMNKTPTRDDKDLPSSKPDYKEADPEDIDFENSEQAIMPKIDGSHVLFDVTPGEQIRAFSYRPAKRDTGLINHTYRVPDLINKKAPQDVPDTVLRGELWAQKNDADEPLESNRLGGILNSRVWKSRAKQSEEGKVRASIFDVAKHEGQDVDDAPFEEKEKIIKQIANRIPELNVPEIKKDSQGKKSLYDKIRRGEHPETREGVVAWNREHGEKPIKVKFKPEYDVKIEDIFPANDDTKYEDTHAGGFVYSWGDENPKQVGRVGTGFSDELRKDMHENPDDYKGLIAKVEGLERYSDKEDESKPGAIRAPSFRGWHLDKNETLPPVQK